MTLTGALLSEAVTRSVIDEARLCAPSHLMPCVLLDDFASLANSHLQGIGEVPLAGN
ncbi:hypothetical protein GCM10007989_38560 [Devosia pacifica]|uniref:Uncharacterized protein n=1 Tax=Devosia pacifica TaxID=1335967 RepID=A0A918SFF5_9HYPH|nr:hypothetical protein GCM10007989_38560 [Devosia pacifica]